MLRKERVGWREIESACRKIAEDVESVKVDRIITIAKGGLLPAVLINNYISKKRRLKPMLIYGVRFYRKDGETFTRPMIYQRPKMVSGETILLVDDIVTTGVTLEKIKRMIELKRNRVLTSTLFYKKGSRIKPDFYYRETDKWIVFPWEV